MQNVIQEPSTLTPGLSVVRPAAGQGVEAEAPPVLEENDYPARPLRLNVDLPAEFWHRLRAVPVYTDERQVVVAVADPGNAGQTAADIQAATGQAVTLRPARAQALDEALYRLYPRAAAQAQAAVILTRLQPQGPRSPFMPFDPVTSRPDFIQQPEVVTRPFLGILALSVGASFVFFLGLTWMAVALLR